MSIQLFYLKLRHFETQSSPGCTCTRRSKFLTHSLYTCMPTYKNRRKMSYLQTTWFSGWLSYECVHLYRWNFSVDWRRTSLCEKCWIANLDFFFLLVVIHAKACLQSVHWLTCLVSRQVQDQSRPWWSYEKKGRISFLQ